MDATVTLIIGLAAGALVGAALGWLLAANRHRDEGLDPQTTESLRLAFIEEASKSRSELLAEQARLNDEKRKADEALRKAESQREREAVRNLVAPVEETLKDVSKRIERLDKQAGSTKAEITQMVTNLTNRTSGLELATTKLGNALSSSQIRGGWGEQELKRLVESAGMREHLDDFATQVPTDLADDSGRPDMAIAVPGGMRILVDSKVPLDALRSAFETDDEDERSRHLKAHADSLRTLVINLAGKDYPSKFENTLDFVLLFVPGDHFLDLALSQRPELLEEALSRRVILTSPSSFFAVLLAISHTWRQQRLADNAKAIQQESSNLYKRLRTVVDHIEKVGTGLRRAGQAYNDAIGSIDRNLITSAERIDAVGGSDGRDAIEVPEPLDIDLVESRKRDLLPAPTEEGGQPRAGGALGTPGAADPEPGEPVRPDGD